jgi:hypothetical protein
VLRGSPKTAVVVDLRFAKCRGRVVSSRDGMEGGKCGWWLWEGVLLGTAATMLGMLGAAAASLQAGDPASSVDNATNLWRDVQELAACAVCMGCRQ